VQAIERSACFSEYYRQRALSLLNKLEKHEYAFRYLSSAVMLNWIVY